MPLNYYKSNLFRYFNLSMDSHDLKVIGGFVGGLLLFGGAIYCIVGWGSKCNSCDNWFARSLVKKDKIKE